MSTDLEPWFTGERWDRPAVVEAQRARAVANAQRRGWDVAERSLLSEPLTPAFVEEFESVHGVTLPPDYRSFLLQVGDGGDGPGLYLRPLGAPLDDSLPWEPGEIHQDPGDPNAFLGQPFLYTETCHIDPSDADFTTTAGALYLFDHGDAMWDLLVVTGDSAGQIWLQRLTDSDGLRPAVDDDGERIGFAAHYCRWLNGG